MGFLSKFEGKMEDTVEGAAEKLGGASVSPVQIAKKAEKQMRREKVVGAGKQFAPTLYTVLVSPEDDHRMFNYYPTLAGETETYLQAKAAELGLVMDGQPLVRFIADDQLKRGKFDVVAELVAAQIVERLRADEMERYGISSPRTQRPARGQAQRSYQKPAQGARPAGPRGGGMQPGAAVAGGAPGNLVPIDHGSPEISFGLDDYDPQYDEINSENIMEPDWAPAPVPQAPRMRADVPPAVAVGAAMAAGAAGAGAPTPAAAPVSQAAPAQTAVPADGELREVYLYDEARDCAYQLTGAPERMGRESSNAIVIPDINASRVHAEIRCEPTGAWVLTDLGSLNGVFVNGRRIKSAPLRDADMIRIGTTELEFQNLEQ